MEAFTEEVLQEVKKSQQETVEINSYMNILLSHDLSEVEESFFFHKGPE